MVGAGPPGGFRYGDHTADLSIRAWGPSRAEAIGQVIRAVAALVVDPGLVSAQGDAWEYAVAAADWISCMVQAVNEYLFLFDSAGVLAAKVSVREGAGGGGETRRICVRIAGERLAAWQGDPPPHSPPKAATYYLASLEQDLNLGMWIAHLILDI